MASCNHQIPQPDLQTHTRSSPSAYFSFLISCHSYTFSAKVAFFGASNMPSLLPTHRFCTWSTLYLKCPSQNFTKVAPSLCPVLSINVTFSKMALLTFLLKWAQSLYLNYCFIFFTDLVTIRNNLTFIFLFLLNRRPIRTETLST